MASASGLWHEASQWLSGRTSQTIQSPANYTRQFTTAMAKHDMEKDAARGIGALIGFTTGAATVFLLMDMLKKKKKKKTTNYYLSGKEGTIRAFDAASGVGFIMPSDGGRQICFLHEAVENPTARICSGQLVTYRDLVHETGRVNAKTVRVLGKASAKRVDEFDMAVGTLVLVMGGVWWFCKSSWPRRIVGGLPLWSLKDLLPSLETTYHDV
ncbi:cold-shock DNA-binding family [Lecanosticta acicola]|uniref:Cold-shock DNA-binding family n=1 Tax=Lecanosticta acicola TaxID=111012 RepID=A0AAI9EFE5_9PEZI|nr:cold-shock DNA-binding family [Lecanosticta acicola]